ncbi:hypothetical protein [Parasitella parasitica]|uniref:CCHC-type domain-containing protein n=1 Tax=Parasitella parasitica TaxID=35722 RepID=A0A0B7NBH7_9FUNG|nr:hypothetical protein [Parasitella parasitica]
MAIIQQSLSSDSVLFSFQKYLFSDRFDAYKEIQRQISSDVEFRPLSLYDDRADGSLLIEAKFSDMDHASQAIQEGVSIQGVVYRALSTMKKAKLGELMHVQFTLLPLQAKQYKRQGFIEGQISMIIDTSVGYQVGQGKWQEAKALSRMLCLSKFDCFVPATYKGAPPICHFCHQSGHILSCCPQQLVKRRCFGCDQPGHIVRFCPPEAKQAVVLDLEEVEEQKETEAVGQEETVKEIPSGNDSEQEQLEENPLDNELARAAPQGSRYSKFAPDSESLSMKVDPPTKKERNDLKRERDIVHQNMLDTKEKLASLRQEAYLESSETTADN